MIAAGVRPRGKINYLNCDSALHVARDCPEPKNPVKFKKNWDAHTATRLAKRRPVDPKWCPPETSENGKCVIDNVPCTCNTVTNRWIKMLLHLPALLMLSPLLLLLLLNNLLGNLPLLFHLKILHLLMPRLETLFLPAFMVILVNNTQVIWDFKDNLLSHN